MWLNLDNREDQLTLLTERGAQQFKDESQMSQNLFDL